MGGFEAPSFSLGLDFDLDSDPNPTTNPQSNPHPTTPSFRLIDDDDDDFDISPIAAAPDPPPPPPPLKRLRRVSKPESIHNPCMEYNHSGDDDDDEIEDFSSEENLPGSGANKPSSPPPYSGCSTSKFSLHGHRVLTTQSTKKCKMTQKENATSTEGNRNTFTFPKLTVSPLRNFQLIDSDSDFDDQCASECTKTDDNKVNSSTKRKLKKSVKESIIHSSIKKPSIRRENGAERDLWDDFDMEKRFTIPTPALDEVCKEYFRSVKNNRTDHPNTPIGNCSRVTENCVQTCLMIDNERIHCKLDDPVPPAHYYFYNDDLRIRNLVRDRLPYFFPLGGDRKGGNLHSASSVIDYRSQFNHGESSKPQAAQKSNGSMSSKKGVKKNSRKSNFEEVAQDSGNWVNPRSSVGIPTDAGKRRVHAVGGQSSGHWLTSPEGKKVYISKTGQELSGRAAYSHYRKESGKAFKRSGGKKKGAGKKKSVGKNKAAAKKR